MPRGAAQSSVFDLYPISRLPNAPAAMLEKFAAPRTSSHLVGIAQRGIREYRDVVAGTMRAPGIDAVFHVAERCVKVHAPA